MNFPTPQGSNSATFTPPPVDGSLYLAEVYDFLGEHSPNHPVFVYDENGSLHTITWSTLARAIHTAARLVEGHIRPGDRNKNSTVVAVLSTSGASHLHFPRLNTFTNKPCFVRFHHQLCIGRWNYARRIPGFPHIHTKFSRRYRPSCQNNEGQVHVCGGDLFDTTSGRGNLCSTVSGWASWIIHERPSHACIRCSVFAVRSTVRPTASHGPSTT